MAFTRKILPQHFCKSRSDALYHQVITSEGLGVRWNKDHSLKGVNRNEEELLHAECHTGTGTCMLLGRSLFIDQDTLLYTTCLNQPFRKYQYLISHTPSIDYIMFSGGKIIIIPHTSLDLILDI